MKNYIIDINNELNSIEIILNQYNLLEPGLLFSKLYRDPIALLPKELKKNINASEVSNIPYHPYLSAYMIKDIIESTIIDHASSIIDFEYNTINGVRNPIYDNVYRDDNNRMYIEDIIFKYVPNIIKKDYELILAIWYNDIYGKIIPIVEKYHDYIWHIDIIRPYFILNKGMNIYEYRFKELKGYHDV